MIFVTGDKHGDFRDLHNITDRFHNLTKNDYAIITGDCGAVFSYGKESWDEKKNLERLEKFPFTTLYIAGNHENHDRLKEYPVECWGGGMVHKVRSSVIHLMHGQVFEIEKKKIFTFGGAYSPDRTHRRKGISYWEDELPNEEEFKEARQNLERANYSVDYVITHTLPFSIICQYGLYVPSTKEIPLLNFLEEIRQTVIYKNWYSGHIHENRDFAFGITSLFDDIRNIETNETILTKRIWG